jgi:nucleoside-diphosphate-sugar epimerase
MGYVGPVVGRHLRQVYPTASLIGLDVGYFANCLTSPGILPECQLNTQYFADVRNAPRDVLRGVTAVVHLAALSNDPMGKAFESLTFEINHKATIQLAEHAKRAGARSFVFASSCSVYGAAEDRPRCEESAVAPITAYAKAKVQAEKDLATLADRDFTVTCLRFATAAGMSPRLRLDLVLNDFVASALSTGQIRILSDGNPWRPMIDVNDMAVAIEWAVERDPDAGGPFLVVNAGSDSWNYQVKDLARAVADAIPGVAISVNDRAQPDTRSYRVDFSLFRRLSPHHQPTATLAHTIDRLRAGLTAIGFADPQFRESSLIRLNRLHHLRRTGMLNDNLEWTLGTCPPAPELPAAVARSST